MPWYGSSCLRWSHSTYRHDGHNDPDTIYQSEFALTVYSSTLSVIAQYGASDSPASLPSGDYILQVRIHDDGDGYLTVAYSSVSTLALDTSFTDGDGVGTPSYQWYADGTAIAGATASSYTPEANNLSLIGTIPVEISQTDSMGTTETIMSLPDALTLNPAGDLDGDTTRTTSTPTSMAMDITRPTKATDSLTRSCSMSTHGATTMVTAWLTLHSSLTTTTTPVVTLCDITNPSELEVRPAPSPSRQA